MKVLLSVLLAFIAVGSAARAQEAANKPLLAVSEVIRRAQHFEVWRGVEWHSNELGQVTYKTNEVTKLAPGLNRLQNGKWVKSTPEITISGNRAIGRGAGHEAVFAGNANSMKGSVRQSTI